MPKPDPAAVPDPSRDFRRTPPAEAAPAEFPVVGSREYRVWIDEAAHRRMQTHASSVSDVELCGVLIGNVFRDGQGPFLRITAVIEGEAAHNYGAQVTFTHQTWTHIHQVKDRDYPRDKIVGWYHTHPGFGVFLSEMDTFIQENFFNQPYQVALVLETRAHEEGCFAWRDGHIAPLPRYWVGQREVALTAGRTNVFAEGGRPAGDDAGAAAAPGDRAAAGAGEPPPRSGSVATLLVALLACSAGVMLGQWWGVGSAQHMLMAFEAERYASLESVCTALRVQAEFRFARDELDQMAAATKTLAPTALAGRLIALSQRFADRERDLIATEGLAQNVAAGNSTAFKKMVSESAIGTIDALLQQFPTGPHGELQPQVGALVAEFLDRGLQADPASRPVIEARFPGLLAKLLPPPAAPATNASGGSAKAATATNTP